jgi:hypothetical protein
MRLAVIYLSTLLRTTSLVAQAQQPTADSASFVTRLGVDTLVVERFVRRGRTVTADVVMRVPRTSQTHYVLTLSESGALERLERTRQSVTGLRRELVTRAGDSLRLESDSGAVRLRSVAAERSVLPFLDMIHWPFEVALMRLRAMQQADRGMRRVDQPMLSGSRVAMFALEAVGDDSMTITHPTRGTSRARVDAAGRLLGLDASATTRKLSVARRPWNAVDLGALAAAWTAQDAAGRSLGALSGRRHDSTRVAGAMIVVDHGTPAKRGREIWGTLVPYGQVWRTGANEATHFSTDRDIVFGSDEQTLSVPAGRYTLFSIPEATGGWLIVSRDTGQAGTAYNSARDLGRVPLERRPRQEPVEIFTIAVTPEGNGGTLRLQWDKSEFVVPFRMTPNPE